MGVATRTVYHKKSNFFKNPHETGAFRADFSYNRSASFEQTKGGYIYGGHIASTKIGGVNSPGRNQEKAPSHPIVLFGAGKVGRRALAFYGAERVQAFCDNNEKLWGKELLGKPVWSYEELRRCAAEKTLDIVLAVTRIDAVREIAMRFLADGVKYRYFVDDEQPAPTSNADCFETIYKNHLWGGEHGFYSGSGSHTEEIIRPYIDLLARLIVDNGLHRVVEIGCGDFNIMQQVLARVAAQGFVCDYMGLDVVQTLIAHNQEIYETEHIHFASGDASKEDMTLPDGDLCIIRQVLQHLTNADIACILEKTKKYRYLLVTEHIYEGAGVQYNRDKIAGAHIRLFELSGVYLEQPPYNKRNIVHLLRVPEDGGIIRTSLVIQ